MQKILLNSKELSGKTIGIKRIVGKIIKLVENGGKTR